MLRLPGSGLMPNDVLRLSCNTRYVVVDLRHARLYVLENRGTGPHVLQSCCASITEDGFGKVSSGDQRTPVSIYHVTAYKTPANASKHYIKVDISDLDLFRYPDDSDLALAEFTQDYSSNNYHQVTRKQQCWHRDSDGRWRIVLEAGERASLQIPD